ncbi:MAG: ribonuclease P protein component [Dehalococcoidia bacterium]|nr:ribonuclease P protein component [Dehalococcoidia bacterium]
MLDPHRLTRQEEFARVMRQGRVQSNYLLLLRAAPNQLETSRFGYAIGKQVGTAVVRNLVRRRLREVARHMPVKSGWDMVISARKASATASFDALKASFEGLTRRAGLLITAELKAGGTAPDKASP